MPRGTARLARAATGTSAASNKTSVFYEIPMRQPRTPSARAVVTRQEHAARDDASNETASRRPARVLDQRNGTAVARAGHGEHASGRLAGPDTPAAARMRECPRTRSEEHTSELQSLRHLVCRLLLEKKN